MQCDDTGRCTVLAWNGWTTELGETLQDYYEALYKKTVDLFWFHYTGGSHFISQLQNWPLGVPKCDVVIADREILQAFATDGRLVPLSTTLGESTSLLHQYPEWLRPWAISSNENIFAVPIRWGITSVLVKKDYLQHVSSTSMDNLLTDSPNTLVWSPKGYFLPSMGLLAMAVSPNRPFILSPDEFNNLEQILGHLAQRDAQVIEHVQDFGKAIDNGLPEVITCAGDWIFKTMQLYEPEVYSKIIQNYQYVFPEGSRPLVFFEMAAVLSSGCNSATGVNFVKLLARKQVRQKVENLSLKYGSYVSNPTSNEGKVIGPDFKEYSPMDILKRAAPRSLPRNFLLQPTAPEWRRVWLNTILAKYNEGLFL